MTKPRTIEQIQQDQLRKTTELLKIGYRLMWKVGAHPLPTGIRDRKRQSGDPLASPCRDSAIR